MTTTIKVSETVEKEVSLPKYFKALNHLDSNYFMILDDNYYVRVSANAYDPNAFVPRGPEFGIFQLKFIAGWLQYGIQELTEEQFNEQAGKAISEMIICMSNGK
jgi:hypothetical protein